jgi:flagellar hook protein FlgE
MSFALSSGVSGLQAHQQMLDVAGNNLANVNTTAFKASRILFSELLSETLRKASQPTTSTGGTNPVQMGSGVGVSGISPNMSQGNIVSTGNSLDMALEGEGYFVLSDGQQYVYTRAGAFAVDQDSYLVDPGNGYRVQRIGSTGEADGFQIAGDSNMHVPYDVAMAAKATSEVTVSSNLSADATSTTQTNVLMSNQAFTTSSGTAADGSTAISSLKQFTAGTLTSATIKVSGYDHDGNALVDAGGLTISADPADATTVDGLIAHINTVLDAGGTAGANGVATLVNGEIYVTDAEGGYSLSDMKLEFSNSGTAGLEMPSYFEVATVGGDEVKNISITVYDSQGGEHVLSGAFVRTDTANTWDMVLTSITGDVEGLDFDGRRIRGVEFNASDGSYAGLNSTIGDTSQFTVTFAHDTTNPQTIGISMGTAGQLDGLTQFAGDSTAVASSQDGYSSGRLSSVSINQEGVLIGAFSNGVKKNIGILQIALFQNTSGLENIGGNYFIPSANSGEAVATQALTGGAGTTHGGSLEKSNADVATEFVNLINAQNGFQANARTIRVATEILKELATLIT